MRNKTPIQKVFDIVENLYSEKIIDYTTKILLIEELDDLLKDEKEQIINAHQIGWMNGNLCLLVESEDYYNQKYNNNGESL